MGNNPFAPQFAPKQPAPSNARLAATVTNILRTPELAQINFQLGGLNVRGGRFMEVANAIGAGRIKCWTVAEFRSQGRDELAPGKIVEARYEIKTNAMLFSSDDYGTNPGEDRTVVHESVHAAFDLNTPKGQKVKNLSIDDEAAAVVAVAFYIRLCKRQIGAFLMDAEGPEKPALELVDSLLGNSVNNAVPGPYNITLEDARAVRDAVAVSRRFNTYIGSDGLLTDNSGALYVYEGVPACSLRAGCK
ncbi:MAG: hypothetical protein ABL984_18505 [Pyrinomonadaceae bacterium]